MAWGHSTIVDPMGQIVSTTDEAESIVFGVVLLSKKPETRFLATPSADLIYTLMSAKN